MEAVFSFQQNAHTRLSIKAKCVCMCMCVCVHVCVYMCVCACVCMCTQSCPTLCNPNCNCQAPLSMEFSRREYWSGLPFPGDLPDPGMEPVSSALASGFFATAVGTHNWYTAFSGVISSWGASLIAQLVKNLPTMQETYVQFPGWEDPLEKEMATHSSILAWRIPRTEEPGRLQPIGSQRVG